MSVRAISGPPARPPAPIELISDRPEVTQSLQDMLAFFTTAIVLCLIIAIITLAVMQILRPLIAGLAQYSRLSRWRLEIERSQNEDLLRRYLPQWLRGDDYDWRIYPGSKHRLPQPDPFFLMRSISNGHLMKQVQDAIVEILARPSVSVEEYLFITRDAEPSDVATVFYIDTLSRRDPEYLAKLLEPRTRPLSGKASLASPGDAIPGSTGIKDAISVSQQAVAAAAERHLNALQLNLEGVTASYVRLMSVIIGIAVAAFGAAATRWGDFATPLILGCIAGLLANLLQDIIAGVGQRRR